MEPRPKMVMMMIMMGHKRIWGTIVGLSGRIEKERILRGEEDGSTLHVYM
jgi:hypothetical protein